MSFMCLGGFLVFFLIEEMVSGVQITKMMTDLSFRLTTIKTLKKMAKEQQEE